MFLHLLKSDPLELSLNGIEMLTKETERDIQKISSMVMCSVYSTLDEKE